MKCLKMRVADVLLFIANLITIYSSNVRQQIVPSSQTTTLVDEAFLKRKFDKYCPQLSKIVHNNNVTDHIIHFKMSEVKTDVSDEILLQQACVIVTEMLSFMFEKKLKVTPDLFRLDEVHFLCPLKLSHLQQRVSKFSNYELVKKLTNKDDCLKLCRDSLPDRPQCLVLKLINYFSQLLTQEVEESDRLAPGPKHTKPTTQNTENRNTVKVKEKLTQQDEVRLEVDKLSAKPEHTKLVPQNTENSIAKSKEKLTQQDEVRLEVNKLSAKPEHTKLVSENSENSIASKKQEKEQYLPESKTKEIISNSKTETTLDKVVETDNNITNSVKKQNTEKITSTPNEEQMQKSEIKLPENEDSIKGDEEFKPELEDQNEDLPNEGVVTMDDSLPDRLDWSKGEKISTLPPKGKEIYPADGFFQAEDSHFFFYFIMVSSIIVVCYLAFHNKNKILAYALEGSSGRRNRRRPNRARYRKLETNLEEVISSNTTNSAVSSVVY